MILIFLGIMAVLIIHWVSDFCLQTDKQAKGKSKNWSDLLSHTYNYSLIWALTMAIYTFPVWSWNDGKPNSILYFLTWMIGFPLITFICHTITDYYTSRVNSILWEQGKVHNFFVSVGFDQVLHYAQLFGTFFLLTWLWT